MGFYTYIVNIQIKMLISYFFFIPPLLTKYENYSCLLRHRGCRPSAEMSNKAASTSNPSVSCASGRSDAAKQNRDHKQVEHVARLVRPLTGSSPAPHIIAPLGRPKRPQLDWPLVVSRLDSGAAALAVAHHHHLTLKSGRWP